LGSQSHCQGCDIGQQDKLAHSLKGEALKVYWSYPGFVDT
jgi:hypothetical protein